MKTMFLHFIMMEPVTARELSSFFSSQLEQPDTNHESIIDKMLPGAKYIYSKLLSVIMEFSIRWG